MLLTDVSRFVEVTHVMLDCVHVLTLAHWVGEWGGVGVVCCRCFDVVCFNNSSCGCYCFIFPYRG